MKKIMWTAAAMLLAATMYAQEKTVLPQPRKSGGMPLMEALDNRATDRGPFSGKTLTSQQMSDLLWAAWGVNRPDGKRTAPSASNSQELELYIFTSEGAFRYDALEHALYSIKPGDFRKEVVTRDFGDTAVDIFFVADLEKRRGDDESKRLMSYIDAGYISQNIYLYCASEGLSTVVYTGSLNRQKAAEHLGLSERHLVVGGQSVGVKE
ncbi:MAG: SagB/ThcOx family dehydrogenase [Rikenellaceae bacterium]|nr:SagB/ThcOx family dehydrogenase [Rikenellaceae bacterium]